MRSPYGLNIIDNCLTCPVHEDRLFCNLSHAALEQLNSIKSTATYPKSAILFTEGQQPRGVFVLCGGKAKLTASSSEGKTIMLNLAGSGELLGLSAVISNLPYEVTAELAEPAQVNFIPRDAFLKFLRDNSEVAVRVAEQLSRNYHAAYQEVRTLGLSISAAEKFTRLLLSWSIEANGHSKPGHITVTLTHEEMAAMIGTSRETVSRLFSDFKKKKLIEVKGSTIILKNKAALERLIQA
jgi:CRP/FNR family transcriptional regulator